MRLYNMAGGHKLVGNIWAVIWGIYLLNIKK